jgi:hypothetical protein
MATGRALDYCIAMAMVPFSRYFPELGPDETRFIIVPEDEVEGGRVTLPADMYGFNELYCDEPGCDCQQVTFSVISRRTTNILATISHAFNPPGPEKLIQEQTFLDPLNIQSQYSARLLEIFRDFVLTDKAYVPRLRRHHKLFKSAIGRGAAKGSSWGTPWNSSAPPDSPPKKRHIPPPPPRRGKKKWQ